MNSYKIPKYNSKRILYLRTYREKKPDYLMVASLAVAESGMGKIVIVGPERDEVSLRHNWQKLFGNTVPFHNHVEYVTSSDDQWRRTIHGEISSADCVMLYLSPKGNRFPRARLPKMKGNSVDDFYAAPFLDPSSGRGLLHEIGYLYRLHKVNKTIVLCAASRVDDVKHRISRTPLAGIAFRMTPDGPRAMFPRFLAFDRQLGRLSDAVGIVPFTRKQLRNPLSSDFPPRLRSLAKRVVRPAKRAKGTRRARGWQSRVLVGKSKEPRRLPPDNAQKIIQFTNVEDLIDIPPREITEVALMEIFEILPAEEAQHGCPECKAPISGVFFYVHGLKREAGNFIKGRCQQCLAYLGVDDGVLRSIGI